MHLVFLIHGLFGNPSHLLSMEESIYAALNASKVEIKVHRARSISAIGTFDGIETNAVKLKAELLDQIKKTKATHLSIVGYSMGGLLARHVIGELDNLGIFNQVIPFLYASFATPHLGSRYTKGGLFGQMFNTVGSRITGIAGTDLFGISSVLNDLADPEKQYLKGLAKFKHLYLFANTTRDRTVHFWTSYISAKNPFLDRKHLKLKYFDFKNGILVDMLSSKWVEEVQKSPNPRTWKRLLLNWTIRLLFPIFLSILINVVGAIAVISYFRRRKSASPDSHTADALVGQLGEAIDETLDFENSMSESINDVPLQNEISSSFDRAVPQSTNVTVFSGHLDKYGQDSPGYKGLIDSTPSELALDAKTLRNIDALNKLPWKKFAVRMTTINTHGQIIDRNHNDPLGKALMDQFASVLCTHHSNHFGKGLSSNI